MKGEGFRVFAMFLLPGQGHLSWSFLICGLGNSLKIAVCCVFLWFLKITFCETILAGNELNRLKQEKKEEKCEIILKDAQGIGKKQLGNLLECYKVGKNLNEY